MIFVLETKQNLELISWNVADEWDSFKLEVSLSG